MNIDTPLGLLDAMTWQRNHLARIKDGGVWLVPRNCSAYTVDHTAKTLTRESLMPQAVPDQAINRVCAAIGWKVIE